MTYFTPSSRLPCSSAQPSLRPRETPLQEPVPSFCSKESDDEEAFPTLLGKLYQIDFLHPPFGVPSHQFFNLKSLIFKIEQLLKHRSSLEKERVRERIRELLKEREYRIKMGELGMVLFYLDRDGSLPEAKSLLQWRDAEMVAEVKKRIEAHRHCRMHFSLPSGKSFYLVREFATFFLTSDLYFNRGGGIALTLLLEQPQFELSQYLEPEHREHVLKVAEKLAASSSIELIFQNPAKIHLKLQKAVRLDLKLSPHVKITSRHIHLANLMSLLFDIRQKTARNCSNFAAFRYVTANYPTKVLKLNLKCLERGYYLFNNTTAIPLAPLWENKLVPPPDVKLEVDGGEAVKLAPFKEIFETLGLALEEFEDKKLTVRELFSQVLRSNGAERLLPFAEELYASYKINHLAQLHLALLEFLSLNGNREEGGASLYSHFKNAFIEHCFLGLHAYLKNERIEEEFQEAVAAKLKLRIWFEYCHEENFATTPTTLITRHQDIQNYAGDRLRLFSALNHSIRMGYLRSGRYELKVTISQLQQCLIDTLKECYQEKKSTEIPLPRLIHAARSKDFRVYISNLASRQMDKVVLGNHLNWADTLFFAYKGGDNVKPLSIAYCLNFAREALPTCKTPYQLLEHLFFKLKNINIEGLKSYPKIMVVARDHHSWALSVHKWEFLFQQQGSFASFIHQHVLHPARARLASPIPNEVAERIIKRVAHDNEHFLFLNFLFTKAKIKNYAHFREWFLRTIHPLDQKKAFPAIEEEFSKIELAEKECEQLIAYLELDLHPDQQSTLFHSLDSQGPLLPQQLAHLVRLSLMRLKVTIADPSRIERAIYKLKNMPLHIDMGDTNYGDGFHDAPSHHRYAVAFSWITEKLTWVLCERASLFFYRNFKPFSSIVLNYPALVAEPPHFEKSM